MPRRSRCTEPLGRIAEHFAALHPARNSMRERSHAADSDEDQRPIGRAHRGHSPYLTLAELTAQLFDLVVDLASLRLLLHILSHSGGSIMGSYAVSS